MIRQCVASDREEIVSIINEAAQAYRDVIPPDRWHEPYMTRDDLDGEISDGVVFYGWAEEQLLCVMGVQDRGDVALIRHAYVRPAVQRCGIGSAVLCRLEGLTEKKLLVGTWRDALWAIRFYEKNGYRLVSDRVKNQYLAAYWNIPARQIETSVVLEKDRHTGCR